MKTIAYFKILIIFVLTIALISITYAAFDGWRAFPLRSQVEFNRGDIGGEGDQLLQGMTRSISNPNIVYLSHDCGHVWRSDDAGHTWKAPMIMGLYGVESGSIEVDPLDPNRILIVEDKAWDDGYEKYDGIYLSSDGGNHFKQVLHSRTYTSRNFEHNIAYDPSSVTTIAQTWYAAMYDASTSPDRIDIYRSDNAGLNWTQTSSIAAKRAYAVQVHPTDGQTIYAGTSAGLFVSHDRGSTFAKVSAGLPPGVVTSIQINSKNPNIIYVVATPVAGTSSADNEGNGKLYKSVDGGASFSLKKDFIAFQVFLNPNYPDVLFLTGNSRAHQKANTSNIIYSSDGGDTWVENAPVTPAPDLGRDDTWDTFLDGEFNAVMPNANNPSEGVVHADARMFRTDDAGHSYVTSSTLYTGNACALNHDGWVFDIFDPKRFFIFIFDTSNDFTNTAGDWFEKRGTQDIQNAKENGYIRWYNCYAGDLQPVAGSQNVIVACGEYWDPTRMFFSNDEGKHWTLISNTLAYNYEVKYNRQNPDIAYAGKSILTHNGSVATPINFGSNYTDSYVFIVGVCEQNSSIIYALYNLRTVLRSNNGGNSWFNYWTPGWSIPPSRDPMVPFDLDQTNCDRFYTVDANGDAAMYDGHNYRSLGLKSFAGSFESFDNVHEIKADPTHEGVVYAALMMEGRSAIFRSLDFGSSWADITYNLPRESVDGLSVNPHSGEVVVSSCKANKILPPPYQSDTYLYDKAVSIPSCFDGIQNGDETGVDCGGSCISCGASYCEDKDSDGYGVSPHSGKANGCRFDGEDCNDNDPYTYPGAKEVCDGKDNQCTWDTGYGQIDENLERNGTNQLGLCVGNKEVCQNGQWAVKSGGYQPVAEICDNVDNNCNGIIDENLSRTITNGSGVCSIVSQICSAGVWTNRPCNFTPSAEVCDNIDNNGNGQIDENLTMPADNVLGLCAQNQKICIAGIWQNRTSNYDPIDEECDGVDNNCNGLVDEGCNCTEGQSQVCGPSTIGICRTGNQTCVNGQWGACFDAVFPLNETCNGLDDNCNSVIDEYLANCSTAQIKPACSTNWQCSNWSDCVNRKKTRDCVDLNGCNAMMPATITICTSGSQQEQRTTRPNTNQPFTRKPRSTNGQNLTFTSNSTSTKPTPKINFTFSFDSIFYIIIFLLFAIAAVLFLKSKSANLFAQKKHTDKVVDSAKEDEQFEAVDMLVENILKLRLDGNDDLRIAATLRAKGWKQPVIAKALERARR